MSLLYMFVYFFINMQGAYSLFHWNLKFVQDSKLIIDERNLSLCLGQITLENLQEFHTLTKLCQCLGGLF